MENVEGQSVEGQFNGGPDWDEVLDEEAPEHPRGTMFLMMIFLLMIIVLWGYMYMTMIGRS